MSAGAGSGSYLADRAGGRLSGLLTRRRVSEQLLDLGPVRHKLGDKWERAAPSVRRFARLVIDRHIGEKDSVTLNGDVFVIRFVGISQTSAGRKRIEMEATLQQMLFGSGEADDPGFPGPQRRGARLRSSRHRSMFRWLTSLRSIIPSFHFSLFSHGRSEDDPDDDDESFAAAPDERPGQGAPDRAASAAPAFVAPRGSARATAPVGFARAGTAPVGSSSPARSAAAPAPAPVVPPSGPAPAAPAPASAAPPAAENPAAGSPVPPSNPASPAPAPDREWWRTNATPTRRTAGHRDAQGHAADPNDLELEFVDNAERHPQDAGDRDRLAAASSRSKGRVRRSSTDALERALFAAIEEAQRQSEQMRARFFPPMGTRCLYRPMWLVESGVLPIYTCIPACALSAFEFVTGEALVPAGAGARKVAALDEMVLENVVSDLAPRQRGQLTSFVCIPAHFETLSSDRAADYFAALDRIPESIRKHILVEIIDISQGVGQLSTYSLVRKLRARVRSVIGRVDLSDMNFRVWRETDLSFIGVDIECENRSETEQIADLNNFVVPARQYGLRTYVRGVRTLSLAAATVATGFDYVDGPAISEGDFTLRTKPQPFGIYDVYK